MVRKDKIKEAFKKADLDLHLVEEPIRVVRHQGGRTDVIAEAIFQMDIVRRAMGKNRKSLEHFIIFTGGSDNDIRVLDVDKQKQQVLLFVKEPARKYDIIERDIIGKELKRETRWTPDNVRKYLMGMDETHLFISQVSEAEGVVNTVAGAHKSLAPRRIRKARKEEKIYRQGEFFFIPLTRKQKDRFKFYFQKALKNEAINRVRDTNRVVGTPHIAEESVYIPEFSHSIIVRGKIQHRDHKTLKLRDWYRVVRNTEVPLSSNLGAMTWID